MKNILDNIPTQISEEVFKNIFHTENIRMERIISKGQTTPEGEWYDQDKNEWVLIIKGKAKLLLEKQRGQTEDTIVVLNAGDYLNIPAHVRHRVTWTDEKRPTIWLAVLPIAVYICCSLDEACGVRE